MLRARLSPALAGAVAGAAAAGVLAAGAGGALAPATGADRAQAAEAAWVAKVSAVCRRYGRELQKVPAPEAVTPLVLGSLADRALPLLQDLTREVRRIPPPATLKAAVAALLHDNAGAILALQRVRTASRRGDQQGAQQAFVVFLSAQSASRRRSAALGVRC